GDVRGDEVGLDAVAGHEDQDAEEAPAQRPRDPHAVEEILSRTTRWGLGWGSGRGLLGVGGPLVAAGLFRCGHGAYSFAILLRCRGPGRGQPFGRMDTLTEEPAESATFSSAVWKSSRGYWWVQISSRGSVPDSSILIAAGQQCGPRCAPRTSSSLSSEMIDQSTLTFSLNTEYSTKVPSLRSRANPWETEAGVPVHST